MNKIFLYSLGVISWLHAGISMATEKFEILPDLPDPLAYAVQPANASTVSGITGTTQTLGTQSIGNEPSIISVVLSLIFVVLLIYLTGILYAKLNKVSFKTLKRQQGELSKSQVSVVSTTQLGNNKTLHVVELDGKRMLIGASSGAIQLIKDLGSINSEDCDEEYSRIEIPNIKIPKIEIPKIEIPSIGFSKLITKTHKAVKLEEDSTETSKETKKEVIKEVFTPETETKNIIEEENQEVIIDSLFSQQNEPIQEIQEEQPKSEHIVDPDDFALYKKYLG